MGLVHLAIILACATLICGQSIQKKCTESQTVANFDSGRFAGLWYEITARMSFIQGGECPTTHYSRLDNNTFEVKNRLCFLRTQLTAIGIAEPSDGDTEGHFIMTYPDLNIEKMPYRVLDTDYTSYSIVGRCINNYIHDVAIYARSPKLASGNKDVVSKILKEITGEDLDHIPQSKQENCCYEPNSATSIGVSMAILISTVIIRFF